MWSPEVWFGGAVGTSISADYPITLYRNRVFTFLPSSSAWSVTLPSALKLKTGYGLFLLINEHATNTIAVKDNAGSTVVTLAGREAVVLSLSANGTAAGAWKGVKSTI